MVHTTLNIFDLIVFSVLGISGLLSFFRGFVKEVLSLGTWIGASLITLYALPYVTNALKTHVHSDMAASGFAALVTFMTTLIVISVFTGILSKFLKSGGDIGVINNLMGLVFGLARGLLLLAVGYFVFTLTTPEDQQPDWLKYSMSKPYIAAAAKYVAKAAPGYLDEMLKENGNDKQLNKDAAKADENLDKARENVDKNWPSMDDLKARMGNATDGAN